MKKKLLCIIRPDLVRQGLGAPLDDCDIALFGKAKREYRWLGDTDGFQVKYRGKFHDAYSIDFEFIN